MGSHFADRSRICISELLDSLAPSIPAAAEAGRRLRTHVEEIDDFLRTLREPRISPASNGNNGTVIEENAFVENIVIPSEYFQRIPWPSELGDSI